MVLNELCAENQIRTRSHSTPTCVRYVILRTTVKLSVFRQSEKEKALRAVSDSFKLDSEPMFAPTLSFAHNPPKTAL